MTKFFLIAIFFCNAAPSFSQKEFSVIYQADNSSKTTLLLAINDSVSFGTVIGSNGKTYKYKLPLGSGFASHNTFVNLAESKRLWQSEPFGRKKFLVEDTVKRLEWKTAEGQKIILGFTCKKAASQDGDIIWIAWYTEELAVPFGPNGITGLPGLILELTNNNHHITYTAIQLKKDAPEIIEPGKGEKISAEKFREVLKQMRNQ